MAGAGCPVHGDGVRHEGGRRSGEEELVVPDVSHVVPPKWEDVRVRADGAPCKRTLKQKVLRRQPACEAVVR